MTQPTKGRKCAPECNSLRKQKSLGESIVSDFGEQNTDLPEWLRPSAACRQFSVGRSWLYEHLAAGDILSRSIRKRGAIRGIRLVNRDSLAAFIEGAESGYEQAEGMSKEVAS